jgi:multiple sugar transport system substrate-binding protein
MLRKILISCALFIVSSTFISCSSSSNGNNGLKKDENPNKGLSVIGENVTFNPNKLVNNGEPIAIEYWTWSDNDVTKDMAKQYTEIYPNVEIKVVVQPWDDYWTKLPLALKGKNGPALFNIHNSHHDNIIQYLAPYDIAITDLEADYNSVGPHIIDGNVYYTDFAINTGNIYYNKQLWQEAGLTELDIPVTWDEFREVAKKLTKTENGKLTQAGFNFNGAYNAIILGLNYQKGTLLFDASGKIVNFDNPSTIENTKFLADLYTVDNVGSPDFGDDLTISFGNGQSAMIYQWGWMQGELINNYPDIEYGVFPTPTPTEETPFAYDRYNGESTPGINNNQTGETQAVAQDFLKFLLSGEQYSKDFSILLASFPTKKSLTNDVDILADPVLNAISKRVERYIWPGPFPSTIETTSLQVIENILYNNEDISKAIADGQNKINDNMVNVDYISLESGYKFFNELK